MLRAQTGHGEDSAGPGRERGCHYRREDDNYQDCRGRVLEKRVEDRITARFDPELLEDAPGRERDQREGYPDHQCPNCPDEARPPGRPGTPRGEYPLHEVERHDVPEAERYKRRPVYVRSRSRARELPEVERTHPFGDRNPVVDGDEHEDRYRADNGEADLQQVGVDNREEPAGERVQEHRQSYKQHADRKARPPESLEQVASGDQVTGKQDGEAEDHYRGRHQLDRPTVFPAVEVRQGQKAHAVQRFGEEQARQEEAYGEPYRE